MGVFCWPLRTKTFNIAIEVKYHRSCYSAYTHKKDLEKHRYSSKKEDAEEEQSVESSALSELLDEVKEALFLDRKVLQLLFIRQRLTNLIAKRTPQAQASQQSISPARNDNVKKWLIRQFQDTIRFWSRKS